MISTRKRMAMWSGVIIITLLTAYSGYQARNYLRGPTVTIENITVEDNLATISGTAIRIAFLTLNGKQIFTDEKGLWQETILLLPGYNIVEVKARDRFGREIKTHRDLYHQ